jgi:iron complex outermembrane receptor protein
MRNKTALSVNIYTAALLIFAARSPLAQETPIVLPGIEVTETRDTVTRVTKEQMELYGANNLFEALSHVPGVTLDLSGARNEHRVSVRGFDHRQVPVFVDGIPFYVPYDWSSDFSRILVEDLEDIEVSKGYSSALLGANTLGGAINLRTAKPAEKAEGYIKYTDYLDSRASHNGYLFSLGAGSRQRLFYAKVTYTQLEEEYFRLPSKFEPNVYEDGGKRDNSYSRDRKLSLMAGLTPTENIDWMMGYIYQRGKKEQPMDASQQYPQRRFWRWPYWDKDSLYTTLNIKFSRAYLKAALYYDTYDNSMVEYNDETFTLHQPSSDYDDYTYGGRFTGGIDINSRNNLQLALSYKFDSHKVYKGGVFTEAMEDETFSIGAEYTVKPFSPLAVVIGGSYDRLTAQKADEEGGPLPLRDADAVNGQAGIFYDLNDSHRLHLTYAYKTRMPTMKERYGGNATVKNVDLAPEEAEHYELGYNGYLRGKINLNAALFYSDARDMIDQRDLLSGSSQYINIAHVVYYGLDIGARAYFSDRLNFGVTLSCLEWDNREGEEKVTDRPEFRAGAYAVIMPFENLKLSLVPRAEYTSSAYSSTDGDEMEKFFLAHLKAVYDLGEHLRIEAGVKNIFDELYEYRKGYPKAGRSYFAGLTGRF